MLCDVLESVRQRHSLSSGGASQKRSTAPLFVCPASGSSTGPPLGQSERKRFCLLHRARTTQEIPGLLILPRMHVVGATSRPCSSCFRALARGVRPAPRSDLAVVAVSAPS